MKKIILQRDLVRLVEFGISTRDRSVIADGLKKLAEWTQLYVTEDRAILRGLCPIPAMSTVVSSGFLSKILGNTREWRAVSSVLNQSTEPQH